MAEAVVRTTASAPDRDLRTRLGRLLDGFIDPTLLVACVGGTVVGEHANPAAESCSALRETPLAGHRPADGPPVESYAEAMWVLSGGPVSGDVADWNAASWISVGPPPRAPARVRAIRIRGRLLLSWIRPG